MQNIINSLKTQFNLSDGSIRELFAHSAVREIPKKQVLTSSFRHMTAQPGITERQMELFFLYCSPQVLLMTVAWYLMVQKITIKSQPIVSALANITQCGLGIYMVHYFIVGIGYLVIDQMGVPISLRIPATALFVFVISWGVVALFYRLFPKAAKWVMG